MVPTLRSRSVFLPLVLGLAALTLYTLRLSVGPSSQPAPEPQDDKPKLKPHPIYKPPKPPQPPPIPEYFPLAARAKSPDDLPPVPSWNRPPSPHVLESTRLYIGFTRYWPLLQQVVVSYIAAGWPPEDIYVVENTGTFDANKRGMLTPSNPFYMNYYRLSKIFGVNVITTSSLQSFAQLQNFYLSEAINNNLTHYFWGHMDVVAQSHEDATPYRSLYQIAVDTIRESFSPTYEEPRWAIRFFSYDWFALVNVKAYIEVGGWDTMISYYGTDCDMHSRLAMNGLTTPIADAGQIFDVDKSLKDLEVLFRRRTKAGSKKRELAVGTEEAKAAAANNSDRTTVEEQLSPLIPGSGRMEVEDPRRPTALDEAAARNKSSSDAAASSSDKPNNPVWHPSPNKKYFDSTEEDTLNSPSWKSLQETLEAMAEEKRTSPYRNSWQLKQKGGQGEPYYYDAEGWEKALQMTIDTGMKIMEEKWGHRGCDTRDVGLKEGDQWRVEHDWYVSFHSIFLLRVS